jgi:hypothetical protein
MPINENAPLNVIPGAIRFNTDSMKLEYYRGGPVGFGTTTTTGEWVNLTTDSPDIQTGGARGLFSVGYDGYPPSTAYTNIIDYVTISSTGNAIDFGDATTSSVNAQGCSSSTRGITSHGNVWQNIIDYVTISSTGNAQDFGDDLGGEVGGTGLSNSTRGLLCGGTNPSGAINSIGYITIASTGNAVDFGDMRYTGAAAGQASSTRGIFTVGSIPLATFNTEFVTISTLGNSAQFGDLSVQRTGSAGFSNSTRGIFAGGVNPTPTPGTQTNIIDYITIATLGNAIDFGDLYVVRSSHTATCSSTRGVLGGGYDGPATTNIMDYITIMSTGNSIDFGDLTYNRWNPAKGVISNGHGGLG